MQLYSECRGPGGVGPEASRLRTLFEGEEPGKDQRERRDDRERAQASQATEAKGQRIAVKRLRPMFCSIAVVEVID